MSLIGKVEEFKETDSWIEYTERLEQYFVANDITEGKKKKAVLLSSCGAKTYKLIRNLVAPQKPTDTTFADIIKLVRNHLDPRPSAIVYRFKFHSRFRLPGESIQQYVAELRNLSEYCEFNDTLEDMLRDRLVCGVNDDRIQRRLLAESKLDFKRAMELATAMETADKNTRDLKQQSTTQQNKDSVNRLSDGQSKHLRNQRYPKQQECYRCGSNHDVLKCRFKDEECYRCHKKGHIAKKCRSKQTSSQRGQEQSKSNQYLETAEDVAESGAESEADNNEYTLYHIKAKETEPYRVDVQINGVETTLEVDTGAAVSLINEQTYKEITKAPGCTSQPQMQSSKVKLRTYTGEEVNVLGTVNWVVKYEQQKVNLPTLVVAGSGPNLMGRDWLCVLKLNWREIFNMQVSENNLSLDGVLNKYSEVFKEGLGSFNGPKAKIHVNKDATPKFLKARPVPYAVKGKIEQELERLEKEGTIEPVQFSEWAAPIVPILKPDNSIRICGDYKTTVNQESKLDNYPIPKVEDLLATIGGGEKFTKLDLSQAYQQLILEDTSKPLTTINTHKGLFQYNRLPYGISSAPGIFQRNMENLLQNIPYVIVRVDDILVSGKNDQDHLCHLNTVLERLTQAGLRLKKAKCVFMKPQVTYLGHKVSKEGIQPMEDKVEAITNAPAPKNVSQLKSYLGMVNYYQKFLPNLSTVLAPLHELLRKDNRWYWGKKQQEAFQTSKDFLKSPKLLVHYDSQKDLTLACDASQDGLGAVLSHRMEDGSEHPVAYASRSLSTAERNYSNIEREALALVFGVKKFHQYLYGRHFKLITDHKPLESLFNEHKAIPSMAAARIQRWALTLAAYHYTIEYKPGSQHSNADALSRLPLPVTTPATPQPVETVLVMELLNTTPVSVEEIRSETRKDPVLSQVVRYVQQGWPNYNSEKVLQPYFVRKSELSIQDGCILWGNRVVIPPNGRERVVEELHETHPGICRMKSLARSYLWWPKMDEDVEKRVRQCKPCQENRNVPPAALLHPWEWPHKPWTRLHLDYAGPFLGKMFLIVVDAYSKWMEAFPMTTSTSNATIEKLRVAWATHGLPEIVVTDNGSNFTSAEFAEFLKQNGIRHIKTAPYHPASNGLAERAVQTFKDGMKKMAGGSVETRVSRFLARYRITPQTTTGVSPAELLLGRRPRSRLDLILPEIGRKVRQSQDSQKTAHDLRARERNLQEEDKVYARNYGSGPKWIPGTLKHSTGPASFDVELEDGRILKRHHDQLLAQSKGGCEPSTTEEIPSSSVPGIPEPEVSTSLGVSADEEVITTPSTERPTQATTHRYPTRSKNAAK